MKNRIWVVISLAGVLAASACGDGDGGSGNPPTGGAAGAGAGGDPSEAGAGGSAQPGAAGSSEAGGSGTGMGASTGDSGSVGVAGGGAPGDAGAAGSGLGGGAGAAGSACKAVEKAHPLAAAVHVAACSEITYTTNPPSSGNHYGNWADYGLYDFALPRGHWVHNLEHGSVVVTYSCHDCADEVKAANLWLDGLEPDAACPSGPPRVLIVPDPELDVRWAASAWGFTLRADCFDAEAFSDFYVKHAGQPPAPEAGICTTGVDFRLTGACGVP